MVIYQFYISRTNLDEYMFFAPREDFISGNREGIYSLIGYISLQLMGYGIGRFLLSRMVHPDHFDYLKANKKIPESIHKIDVKKRYEREKDLFFQLLLLEALLIAGTYLSTTAFDTQLSRRLCNLPYVLL